MTWAWNQVDWLAPLPFLGEGLSYKDAYFEELMFEINKRERENVYLPETTWYRYKNPTEREIFIPRRRPELDGQGLCGFSAGFDNYILDMRRAIERCHDKVGLSISECLNSHYGWTAYKHPDSELGKRGSLYDIDLDELRTLIENLFLQGDDAEIHCRWRWGEQLDSCDNNFGGSSVIRVMKGYHTGYQISWLARAYLKRRGEASLTCRLRLAFSYLGGAWNEDVDVHEVAHDSWQEMNITWNNQPALGMKIGTFRFHDPIGWFEIPFDISARSICMKFADEIHLPRDCQITMPARNSPQSPPFWKIIS